MYRWPLNPKAMDNKIRPSRVYIVANVSNVRNEEDYTTKKEVENNLQWGKILLLQNFSIQLKNINIQDLKIYLSIGHKMTNATM
jgi:hypothetical protein